MMQTGGPLGVHAACTCASSALGVCSAPASVLAASSRASDLGDGDGRDMRSDVDGGNHGTDADKGTRDTIMQPNRLIIYLSDRERV